jgi:hypothetical protein
MFFLTASRRQPDYVTRVGVSSTLSTAQGSEIAFTRDRNAPALTFDSLCCG